MQQRLIFDSIIDALGEIVRACGGPKAVGAKMRPELPVEQAAGWLRDCMNAGRREHFTPEQVLFLLRLGRDVECHAAMHYLAGESGYSAPAPVSPETEAAQILVRTEQLTHELRAGIAALERLTRSPLSSVKGAA